jgi:hypothetical protein
VTEASSIDIEATSYTSRSLQKAKMPNSRSFAFVSTGSNEQSRSSAPASRRSTMVSGLLNASQECKPITLKFMRTAADWPLEACTAANVARPACPHYLLRMAAGGVHGRQHVWQHRQEGRDHVVAAGASASVKKGTNVLLLVIK